MLRKKILLRLSCILAGCFCLGCNKDYLDKKPNQSLLVPTTLNDFQALLDNGNVMLQEPGLNEFASDDFYLSDEYVPYLAIPAQNSYVWAKDMYQGASIADWNIPYKQVFYSNIVLEGLEKTNPGESGQKQWSALKGAALFYRANAFFNLAQVFAAPYQTDNLDLPGIPIKLTSDINVIAQRGTLAQTYNQIREDLTNAIPLLPETVPYKNRPTKSSAYGLLSRMYLIMGKYEDAITASSNYLSLTNTLLDYNSLDPSKSRPFPKALPFDNTEVASFSTTVGYGLDEIGYVVSSLYDSYDQNDMRKAIFFDNQGGGVILFKGSYTGTYSWFDGISTNEVYLIRAESYVRGGSVDSGLADLNTLLMKRWKKGTFRPFDGLNDADALTLILKERRKELIGRGLRWQDLRRLNTDPRFAVTLTRTLKGVTYKLEPLDKRYTFPIPDDEIANSGISQNPR